MGTNEGCFLLDADGRGRLDPKLVVVTELLNGPLVPGNDDGWTVDVLGSVLEHVTGGEG